MYVHTYIFKTTFMKTTTQLFTMLMAVLFLTACGGGKKTESEETQTTETSSADTDAKAMTFSVDASASTVAWKGEVAGVYGHNGVIDVQEGNLMTQGEMITSGKVVIDMTSIQPLDSASYSDEEGKRASDLVAHLSTGDFFLVEEYPTATFEIKKHEGDQLIGDLTIRGNTNEEAATISMLEVTPEGLKGKAKLVFDRQKYDVNWEHFIKDYVLSDDIEMDIALVAKAQ
jgi:polyisoprenoid-binding protein YceI